MASKAQRARRLKRAIELSVGGLTYPEISTVLKKEGYAASERTVGNILRNVDDEIVQEVRRMQLTDIAIETDSNLRMKYRDLLLRKMMPHKVEQKVDSTVKTFNVEALLLRSVAMKANAEMLDKNR